jgi:hypothetical protein
MPAHRPPHDIVEVALEVSTYLSSHNCDYAFGGALALGYWAAPRGTIDVDVTLYISPDDPSECVGLLRDAGCDFQRIDVMVSLQEHGFCRVTYHGFQLDVFLPTIAFYEHARLRRRRVSLEGQPVMIWDPETLCVFKMMFFRRKDVADVEQILRVQGNKLDRQWVVDRVVEMYGARDPRVTRWRELVDQVSE